MLRGCSSCEPLAPMEGAHRGPSLVDCDPFSASPPVGLSDRSVRFVWLDRNNAITWLPDGLVPSEALGSLARTK